MKKAFFSTTPENFRDIFFEEIGPTKSDLSRLLSRIYRYELNSFPKSDPHFSDEVLAKLDELYHFHLPKLKEVHCSQDGTIKFLLEFSDGHVAEMVAMSFHKKYTLCLSSQVGCAMKCSFCFTGTQGLTRHLTSDEIVGQYVVGRKYLIDHGKSKVAPNIVFMGQGEPLHNFEALKEAIDVLTAAPGLKLGARQITVSTVGYLPGLERFNELGGIHLAISLHSAFNEERSELIPTNKKWNLDDLMTILKELGFSDERRVNFEYLLLKGFNDSADHAKQLHDYISQIPNLLNIIPFNPYPGSQYERPSQADIEDFKKAMVRYKVRTMVRRTRGDDILAACGQLANQTYKPKD